MICINCRKAGDSNQLASEVNHKKQSEKLLKEAEKQHSKCQGKAHCNCQHFVGPFVKKA